MYGAGVSPSLVFNDARSGANQIASIKSLKEHNKKLLDEVDHWKSLAHDVGRVQFDSDETQVPPDDILTILNIANRVDLEFSSNDTCTSADRNLQVGSRVCLKSTLDPTTAIVAGILYSTDPAQEVNGRELGAHHFEIYVQYVAVPSEHLDRPCRQFKTIGETVGMHIAWPKPLLLSEAMEAYLNK